MRKKMMAAWALMLAGFVVLGSSPSAGLYNEQPVADIDVVANTLRLSPAEPGFYDIVDVIYNPHIDSYVAFGIEWAEKNDIVYSRLFNKKGNPISHFRKIAVFDIYHIGSMDVAFSLYENTFCVVHSDWDEDGISAALCSGEGLLMGSQDDFVEVKSKSGYLSGLLPRVEWVQARNQYAVHWIHCDEENLTSYRNGHYLSLLNDDLSFAVKKRKVRQQSMRNNYHFADVLPFNDGLLWGSAEDMPGPRIKPVVWFTRFNGQIRTDIPHSDEGLIYPGPVGDGDGQVHAVYNEVEDNFLLHWNEADGISSFDKSYAVNRYRIMNRSGRFLGTWKELPKKSPFQTSGFVVHNPVDNRYFGVFPEYKQLAFPDRYWFRIRGRLWGLYLDNRGNLEGKGGAKRWAPVPLTQFFGDGNTGLRLKGMSFQENLNDYLYFYRVRSYLNYRSRCWGKIFR